jgi:sugar-specific transcriptional regulator TrmB
LSFERAIKILEGFSFSRKDAEVYIYLAKTGPSKGRDLIIGLRMVKQQLYPILKQLQKKGVVTSSQKRPAIFAALAFEELINLYVKLDVEKAKIIRETKEELLDSWKNVTKKENS